MTDRILGLRWSLLAATMLGLAGCGGAAAGSYDIVLKGGRVMDPESGLDAVRDVGIRGDRIAAISEGPLTGTVVVDVKGHVVAPGFIDLHAHGQDLSDNQWQARDGVTTALEMESGSWPVAEWYANRAKDALLTGNARRCARDRRSAPHRSPRQQRPWPRAQAGGDDRRGQSARP